MLLLNSLRKQRFWKDFDMRARVWSAWYYLIWIRAENKFDMRARAARVASWDRNVQSAMVFL